MDDKKVLKEDELENVTGGSSIGSGGEGDAGGAGGGSGVVIKPEPNPDLGPTSPITSC